MYSCRRGVTRACRGARAYRSESLWNEGKIVSITLKANVPGSFRIKLSDTSTGSISLLKNQKPVSLPVIDNILNIDLNQGDEFVVQY